MPLDTRPLSENDLPDVIALWRASPGVGLNESDTLERLASFLERNPDLSLVVRDGERIVAAVLCGHDGRRGYLHHLTVAADFQRQGIGTQLAEACAKNLASLGILKCNIFVYNNNDEGTDFWRANGWGDRADLKIMQRVL